MCLTVKKEVKVLVKKCKKAVKLNWNLNNVVTPFQEFKVPLNGLLLPGESNRYPELKRDTYTGKIKINGGYIHAYTNQKPSQISHGFNEDGATAYFDAYAFWTVALGSNNDLACKALYIPFLDLTKRRDARVSMLENRYNKNRLIKEFNLGDVLGDY